MTIGQRIKQMRILRGFASQQSFADALGVAQSYVHKIEASDGKTMQVGTLIKISQKLNIKPGDLLDAHEFRRAAQLAATVQSLGAPQEVPAASSIPVSPR